MMAAQLLRQGIRPMIVDARPGPSRKQGTVLLQARAMEVFRQLGLADRLLAKGNPLYTLQVTGLGGRVVVLDFSRMEEPDTAFPFILGVEREEVDRVLLDRLTESACPVEWNTRLEWFKQDDSGAYATVRREEKQEKWRWSWVINTDGDDNRIRQQMGIPFDGGHRPVDYFVMDVPTDTAKGRVINVVPDGGKSLTVIPTGVSRQVRVIGYLSPTGEDKRTGPPDIQTNLLETLGVNIDGTKLSQIKTFSYRKTAVEQMRRQRCLLIGNAAHSLSPLLSRELNEGIYDAANLAWKLAGVVNGRMVPAVLDTYQQERLPVVKAGGGLFDLDRNDNHWLGWRQRMSRAKQLNRIIRNPARGERQLLLLSGTDVNYRFSPLSLHHTLGSGIRAGDRLPYLPVFDEKLKTQTDLHRWCEKPGFILLVLGTVSHHYLNIIGQWMRQKYPREMHLYYLPYSLRNEAVFSAFEMKPEGIKMVLIRPDMHIAYMNDALNLTLIDTYMEEILGWAFFGHLPEKR